MTRISNIITQRATSTNNNHYNLIKTNIEEEISREKKRMLQAELPIKISLEEFRDLFARFGTYNLLQLNQKNTFEIDEYIEPIIKQLYFFFTRNPDFAGDLNKGIMLQGKFGCGKTVIMETYSAMHNFIIKRLGVQRPLITFIKSLNLQENIVKQGRAYFEHRPLIIDEFGREAKIIQDFGNVLRPISELLSIRGDNGSLTHGTTNFLLDTLKSKDNYGMMIGDRLKKMFNFIILEGDSRRK